MATRMTLADLPVGTRVYNHGDMANRCHFGTVTAHRPHDRFGDDVEITPDPDEAAPGRHRTPYVVSVAAFSREFLGHHGTRFVTEAAHRAWREAAMAAMAAALKKMGIGR